MELNTWLDNMDPGRFRQTANRLLVECFLVKKDIDTSKDYYYFLKYQQKFQEFFEILGCEITVNEVDGVVALKSANDKARDKCRLQLKKIESVLFLIVRLLYIEQRMQLTMNNDITITVEDIIAKYNILRLKAPLDKNTLRNTLSLMRRYHLLRPLDGDITAPETRLTLYNSLLAAMPASDIDTAYRNSQARLEQYQNGGDDSDNDTDIDENAD